MLILNQLFIAVLMLLLTSIFKVLAEALNMLLSFHVATVKKTPPTKRDGATITRLFIYFNLPKFFGKYK